MLTSLTISHYVEIVELGKQKQDTKVLLQPNHFRPNKSCYLADIGDTFGVGKFIFLNNQISSSTPPLHTYHICILNFER